MDGIWRKIGKISSEIDKFISQSTKEEHSISSENETLGKWFVTLILLEYIVIKGVRAMTSVEVCCTDGG